ncbi:ABC transporter permease [Nakamurella flavida]|uniref:ABC transporter permease n=1 Tax=Nakamurella flavida TaxID=363630 RepID=A0A938YRT3_9ACTN|nr:ABC transporter permease [Nakamurella flavida]MBM9478043.1 ABC transporter permease [Nakamurella flavida]MDP9778240.1 peptide/nickel transport system permease protein [Nakamurella flavida]
MSTLVPLPPVTGTPPTPASVRRRRRPRIRGRARVGAVLILLLVAVALLAPLLAPHDPESVDATQVLGSPSFAHPFGSDALGRDVLSRVLYGFRVSLAVAIGSVAVATLFAVPLGLLAGYFGGWVDTVISRPLDMVLVLPALLLAVTLIAIIGPGSLVAALAIAIIYLPILARVMRAGALTTTALPFVEGARARGTGHLATITRHVLPNSVGALVVQASVLAGFAMQVEAALSYLGLGAQPPTPSLGLMLADGRDVLGQAPWVEIYPGVAIALTVLALNLLGDGLRSALDPDGVSA